MIRKHSPKFYIVGSGSELENAKKLAKKLRTDNVVFYGRRPLGDMPKLYKIADAILVTLKDKPYANMTNTRKSAVVYCLWETDYCGD